MGWFLGYQHDITAAQLLLNSILNRQGMSNSELVNYKDKSQDLTKSEIHCITLMISEAVIKMNIN